MNIGIYVDSLAGTEKLEHINNVISHAIDNKSINDASVFYDDVGYVPFKTKYGMFNSADLWNFSGNLLATSFATVNKAINIVNNINLFYYYSVSQNIKVLNLLKVLENKIEIICHTEEDAKELYRVTGKRALGISHNFTDILEIMKGYNDGRTNNNTNVYRSE